MTVTHPLYLFLLLLALVLFLLAAFNVSSARINLLGAGLAAWVLVQVLTSLSIG
jgi:hypothetical protein